MSIHNHLLYSFYAREAAMLKNGCSFNSLVAFYCNELGMPFNKSLAKVRGMFEAMPKGN